MKDNLKDLREEIDAIDSQLVTLLAKRFAVTERVGILKKQLRTNAQDPEREAQQFQKLTVLAKQTNLDPESVKAIWRTIMNEVIKRHKNIQKETNVTHN